MCILICWLDKLLWFIFFHLVRMIQSCKYLFQYIISKIGLLSVGNINNNFKPMCHFHYRWCTEIILYCNVMCFVCKCNKMHLSYYWVIILSTCLYYLVFFLLGSKNICIMLLFIGNTFSNATTNAVQAKSSFFTVFNLSRNVDRIS